MDFMVCLSKIMRQRDSICVIVHMMTKSAYFIPVRVTYKVEDYVKLYINEIVRWHEIPLSII